jgi:uncharacterized UBP type Zn finger protein
MADVDPTCSHLEAVARREHGVTPSAHGCTECLASGSGWVHLRLCLTCGHVGCCDNSPNRHATRHYHATQHPVIRSFEPGEPWGYCFVHDAFVREIRAFDGEPARVHYSPGSR